MPYILFRCVFIYLIRREADAARKEDIDHRRYTYTYTIELQYSFVAVRSPLPGISSNHSFWKRFSRQVWDKNKNRATTTHLPGASSLSEAHRARNKENEAEKKIIIIKETRWTPLLVHQRRSRRRRSHPTQHIAIYIYSPHGMRTSTLCHRIGFVSVIFFRRCVIFFFAVFILHLFFRFFLLRLRPISSLAVACAFVRGCRYEYMANTSHITFLDGKRIRQKCNVHKSAYIHEAHNSTANGAPSSLVFVFARYVSTAIFHLPFSDPTLHARDIYQHILHSSVMQYTQNTLVCMP